MYKPYWGLKTRPFRNTPDPRFFYHSRQHDDALLKLTYAVSENLGAAILTGAYGCGKTLLSRMLAQQLGPSVVSVFCNAHPDMTPLDLLRVLARGSDPAARIPDNRAELLTDALLETIGNSLTENARDGKHTVVVLDEAHLLDNRPALETTRLLLNFHSNESFLLTLLLVGHPELTARILTVKQLAQRIPVTCHLDFFGEQDTAGYVLYRLAVGGCERPVFSADALAAIHRQSGGIPRRINSLCDMSLTVGFAQKAREIDAGLVLEAMERFGTGGKTTSQESAAGGPPARDDAPSPRPAGAGGGP
jgi:general secretion pathway protein A